MTSQALSDVQSPPLDRNRPGVVAEVNAAFSRYEAALVAHDLDGLAASFSEAHELVRFGVADHQRGPDELARWRAAQPALPPGRTLHETTITTYGTALAVVTTLFCYPGRAVIGRQSQTWVRDGSWKIVHAHVSEISADSTVPGPVRNEPARAGAGTRSVGR